VGSIEEPLVERCHQAAQFTGGARWEAAYRDVECFPGGRAAAPDAALCGEAVSEWVRGGAVRDAAPPVERAGDVAGAEVAVVQLQQADRGMERA
jgi:hypothetical protein